MLFSSFFFQTYLWLCNFFFWAKWLCNLYWGQIKVSFRVMILLYIYNRLANMFIRCNGIHSLFWVTWITCNSKIYAMVISFVSLSIRIELHTITRRTYMCKKKRQMEESLSSLILEISIFLHIELSPSLILAIKLRKLEIFGHSTIETIHN
jgi:hypothetical protein